MGSYGIGPARIVAAAIEQGNDDAGIIWPAALAPFDVHIVLIGKPDSEQGVWTEESVPRPERSGVRVLFDDRADVKPGEKFVEAELLGCPLRITVGARTLPDGPLEAQIRGGRRSGSCPSKALWTRSGSSSPQVP